MLHTVFSFSTIWLKFTGTIRCCSICFKHLGSYWVFLILFCNTNIVLWGLLPTTYNWLLRLAIFCVLSISALPPAKHPPSLHLPFLFLTWKCIAVQSEISPSFFFPLVWMLLFFLFVMLNLPFCRTWVKRICFVTFFFLLSYSGAEHITNALFNLSYWLLLASCKYGRLV